MKKIIVKNLHKEFTVHTRGGLKIDGYHDINFELEKGEFLSLYGPSGMGKSSVLKHFIELIQRQMVRYFLILMMVHH